MGAIRACVLHPDIAQRSARRRPELALAEAVSLACALPDMDVVNSQIIRLPKVRAGLLFGKGKLDDISALIADQEIDLVLIDGPVSPIQQRNLERHWKVKVLDRTGLILEIFGERAQTREGVLQVDLAALMYAKSRLVRSWTHLERQRGGLGFVGGAGETQIESDRRAIDDAIQRLKKQLSKVAKTRALHRAARKKTPFPIVALVGYTNAGKSTLFNKITGSTVLSKDMLFATLDPTMRAVTLPDQTEVILSDTVGFISDLPPQLVAAFRATLEEVLDADLVLHVRDISHPETTEQSQDVDKILQDLGIETGNNDRLIKVWNKCDLLLPKALETAQNLTARKAQVFTTSALTGDGVCELLTAVSKTLSEATRKEVVTLSFSEGKRRAWLYEQNVVEMEKQIKVGFEVTVNWSKKQSSKFKKV